MHVAAEVQIWGIRAVVLALVLWAVLAARESLRGVRQTSTQSPLRIRLQDPPPPSPDVQPAPVTALRPPPREIVLARPRIVVPEPLPETMVSDNRPASNEGGSTSLEADPGPATDSFGLNGTSGVAAAPGPVAIAGGTTGKGAGTRAYEPGVVEAYALAIWRILDKDKRYPRRAQINHWEGTALVEIQVSDQAKVVAVTLKQSSGHAILDEEALEKVRRATDLPPPPEAARGRDVSVIVPFVFQLQ